MISKANKPIISVCAILLVLILSIAVLASFWPRYEDRFFEFGLLGKNRLAENYYPNDNGTLAVGSIVDWNIYLHNHMGEVQNISIMAKLINSTMNLPDDRNHSPSSAVSFIDFPLSLSINETRLIPFSWSILEATGENNSVTLKSLKVNDQIITFSIPTVSNSSFMIVFELWVYDQLSHEYAFGWEKGDELFSSSLYMEFKVNLSFK